MNRVNRVAASDLAVGFAAIGESVRWITTVNEPFGVMGSVSVVQVLIAAARTAFRGRPR